MATDPLDPAHSRRGHRLKAAAAWLDATPAETMGLAFLLLGGSLVTALVWWLAVPRPAPSPPALPLPQTASAAEAEIAVHVAGAVRRPGVVRLPKGARVDDALEAAGGAAPNAALDALNLARSLSDGDQVVVPLPGETPPEVAPGKATPSNGARRPDGRLDLNRASAAELEELPGIGEVLAARIVAWRDEHGPFTAVGELRDVPGIGERTFQNLADLLSV